MTTTTQRIAIAVLRRDDGAVLLQQRHQWQSSPGVWELPGGKAEAGESVVQALIREVYEELRITARRVEPVMVVHSVAAAGHHLSLHAYLVTDYDGEPVGNEGQPLHWCHWHELVDYPLPPGSYPVVHRCFLPPQYLITRVPQGDIADECAAVERALQQYRDARLLQLRDGDQLSPSARRDYARRLRDVASACAAMLVVNDDVSLAASLGVGVHLRERSLLSCVKRPLPLAVPVGASCHDASSLAAAARLADFATLSPLRPTKTHPHAPSLGWTHAEQLLRSVPTLRVYLLGGMTTADTERARAIGAHGVAGIRCFYDG